MDKNKWFSERLNQFVDLEKFPKDELIAEVFAERRCAVKTEDDLKKSS